MKKLLALLMVMSCFMVSGLPGPVYAQPEATVVEEPKPMDIFSWTKELSLDGDSYYLIKDKAFAFGLSVPVANMFDEMLEFKAHYVTDFNTTNDVNDKYGLSAGANGEKVCNKYCEKVPLIGKPLRKLLSEFEISVGIAALVDGKRALQGDIKVDPAVHFRIIKLF